MAIKLTARRMSGGERHEHVSEVRWLNDQTGASDTSTRQQMVEYIKKNGNTAVYCPDQAGIKSAWVHVNTNGRTEYIQTRADNEWTNNILALPLF